MPFSGSRLRELRDKAGMERDRLAELAKTTKQYIAHLENGVKNNPAFDLVERLAAALGADCRAFTVEDSAPTPAQPEPDPPVKKAGKSKGKKG